MAALARYDWPGNVRELQNAAALAVDAPRRGVVGPSSLPATLARVATPAHGATLQQARRVFDTRFVREALVRAGGHRGRAAAELGVTRQGLAKLWTASAWMQTRRAPARPRRDHSVQPSRPDAIIRVTPRVQNLVVRLLAVGVMTQGPHVPAVAAAQYVAQQVRNV